MRKNKYICDICGKEIVPEYGMISLPGGSKIKSNKTSINQIVFAQVEADNYILSTEQQKAKYDVCKECWDAFVAVLRIRRELKEDNENVNENN